MRARPSTPTSSPRTPGTPWLLTALSRRPASVVRRSEPDRLAGAKLGAGIQIRAGDVRDDGVAAGHRMVGQKEDRQARGWDLQRAHLHTLARQLPLPGALQRFALQPYADPVAL